MEKKPYNPGIVGLDGKSWSQMKQIERTVGLMAASGMSFSQTNTENAVQLSPKTTQPQPTKTENK